MGSASPVRAMKNTSKIVSSAPANAAIVIAWNSEAISIQAKQKIGNDGSK